MRTFIYLFTISLATFFLSCKKKETPPPEPTIELVSVSPTTIIQFKDSVILKISYKDNNGDIGDVSADEYSLYIKDSRLPNADMQHIKPLAPIGSNVKIEGALNIKLNSLFLLGNSTSETTVFTIKIKDQAGHWSNEVTSSVITITQ